VASASSLLWTAASARSSAFLSRATRRSVIAVSAVPIACSYRALAPKTNPASQAATKPGRGRRTRASSRNTKPAGQDDQNGPRRSASPRSMGCLSDISRPRGRRQGLLWWTFEQPSADRRTPRWTNRHLPDHPTSAIPPAGAGYVIPAGSTNGHRGATSRTPHKRMTFRPTVPFRLREFGWRSRTLCSRCGLSIRRFPGPFPRLL
jgi:hypothetical protein